MNGSQTSHGDWYCEEWEDGIGRAAGDRHRKHRAGLIAKSLLNIHAGGGVVDDFCLVDMYVLFCGVDDGSRILVRLVHSRVNRLRLSAGKQLTYLRDSKAQIVCDAMKRNQEYTEQLTMLLFFKWNKQGATELQNGMQALPRRRVQLAGSNASPRRPSPVEQRP
eukprot:6214557-Pleurochrysis_carterae.AAC.6